MVVFTAPLGWLVFFIYRVFLSDTPDYDFRDSPDLPPVDGSDPYQLARLRDGTRGAIELAVWTLFRRGIVSLDAEGLHVRKPDVTLHNRYEQAALFWAKSKAGKLFDRTSYHLDEPFAALWREEDPRKQYAAVMLRVPAAWRRRRRWAALAIAAFYGLNFVLCWHFSIGEGRSMIALQVCHLFTGVLLSAWVLAPTWKTESMYYALLGKLQRSFRPLRYHEGWQTRQQLTWPELLLLGGVFGVRETRGMAVVKGPRKLVPQLAELTSADGDGGSDADSGAEGSDAAAEETGEGGAAELVGQGAESAAESDQEGDFFDAASEGGSAEPWSDGGFSAGFESSGSGGGSDGGSGGGDGGGGGGSDGGGGGWGGDGGGGDGGGGGGDGGGGGGDGGGGG